MISVRHSELTHTHTHTLLFIHSLTLPRKLKFCFLPVKKEHFPAEKHYSNTHNSILSIELSIWGLNVRSTSVAATSKLWVSAILLLLFGGK